MIDFFAAVKEDLSGPVSGGWLTSKDPFDPSIIQGLFIMFKRQLDDIAEQVDDIEVTNELTYDTAQETVAAASKLRNAIESKRKELKAPYLAVTRVLDGEANGLINRIKEIEDTIKSQKLLPYLQSNESEKHKSETSTGKIDQAWDWDVVNFQDVPEEIYQERKEKVMQAISPGINAMIRAGIRNIPGIKIFPIDKVKVTRRK